MVKTIKLVKEKKNTKEKYSIQQNFLNKEEHDNLFKLLISPDFPYYYNDWHIEVFEPHKEELYFSHLAVNDGNINSNFYNILVLPFLSKLNIKKLVRVRVNLYINQGKRIISDYHIDQPNLPDKKLKCMTGVYYVNTNNGYTEMKDKVIVPSVANQYLEMDNYIEHRAAQQTDTKYRIVINFNYLV